MGIISTAEIENEELFLDYRLPPKAQPSWYKQIDDSTLRRWNLPVEADKDLHSDSFVCWIMIGDIFALLLAILFVYYLVTKHFLSRKCRNSIGFRKVASKSHSAEDSTIEDDDSDFGRAVKFVRSGKFRLQDASVFIYLFVL